MRTTPTKSTLTLTLTLAMTLTLAGLTLPSAAAQADEPRFDPAPSPALVASPAPAQPDIIELQAVDREQPLRVNRPVRVGQVYAPAPAGVQLIPVQQRFGYVPCDGGMECMTDKQALKLALQADPAYSAATGKMVGGIVLTAVGGAAAVVLGLAAMLSSLGDAWCSDWDYDGGDHGCQQSTTSRDLGIGALVSLGVGLGVGLPVLISGAVDRKEIRQRVMQQQLASQAGFGLAGGPGQAGLGLRYAF